MLRTTQGKQSGLPKLLIMFAMMANTSFVYGMFTQDQRDTSVTHCCNTLTKNTRTLTSEEISRFCLMKVGWHIRAEAAATEDKKLEKLVLQLLTPILTATGGARSNSSNITAVQDYNYTSPAFGSNSGASNESESAEVDTRPFQLIDRFGQLIGGESLLLAPATKAKRREYRLISDTERLKLHEALNVMKKDLFLPDNTTSVYDAFVEYHKAEQAPGAHGGPAFLPFHRELLKQFELALRTIDPDLAIPFWDSTLDHGLPTPADSIIWTDDFLGNGNGQVSIGAFANWTSKQPLAVSNTVSHHLYRKVISYDLPYNRDGSRYWFLHQNISNIISSKPSFESLFGCNNEFEPLHGRTHVFVGGHMDAMEISPNDPVFYMHHSFVDYLWEEFRQQRQSRQERETQYPSNENACCKVFANKPCPKYYFANSPMKPFPIRNIDGLSNSYTDQFYEYEPPPRCNATNPSCGSRYLFCNTHSYFCMSKIRTNGNCQGLEDQDACFEGACVDSKCTPTGSSTSTVTEPIPNDPNVDDTSTFTSSLTFSFSTTSLPQLVAN